MGLPSPFVVGLEIDVAATPRHGGGDGQTDISLRETSTRLQIRHDGTDPVIQDCVNG